MSLIETFRYHSRVLASKSSALEVIHHAGDRGAEREDILEEFLTPRLPDQLAIGRREVRATNGRWSKQEDLIIYDRLTCPRLFVGSRSQIFPVESIAAVIEVKTRLNTASIREASENIRQVRSLKKTGQSTRVGSGSIEFGPPTPTFGALFAYDLDLSLETFRERWVEAQSPLQPEHRINLVCILDEMVMIHVDRTYHLWDSTSEEMLNNFTAMNSKEDSLLAFTLALMRVLAEFRFGVPDLFKYVFSGDQGLEFKFVFDD